jgi:hypothetical protein
LDLTAHELASHSRTASPIFGGPHGPPGGGEMEIPLEMANGKGEDGSPLEMQKRVDGGGDELEEGQKSSQSCKDAHEVKIGLIYNTIIILLALLFLGNRW